MVPQCGVAVPDEARLRRWVEHLAVPRHMYANARGNARIREDLAAALERCGLTVRIQGRYRNIVALPDAAGDRPITLVAAHYDSVPGCPGADDNASGLAVMLECARVLAAVDTGGAVGFIAFNAEEDGLLGSRDFIDHGLPALGLRVRTAHVLEMVGFRDRTTLQRLPLPWVPARLRVPDFLGVIAKGGSNGTVRRAVRSSAAPGLRLLAAKTWGPLHRLLPDLTRSDHFAFWAAGRPAVLWTDTGNFRNPNYHASSDTPDTLDYTFMREVTELLSAVVAQEAAL